MLAPNYQEGARGMSTEEIVFFAAWLALCIYMSAFRKLK